MPRAKVIRQAEFPYHINNRCINKEWFSIPMDDVWDIMSNQLYYVHKAYEVQIHSFVLMTNHYHALISTPQANIDVVMWNFGKETSRYLTAAGNRINQTYGNRYFWTIIDSFHHFLHAYKYVYFNPVKAGLVDRAEQYKYSTLNGLLGLSHIFIPTVEDTLLFPDVESNLNWINTRPAQSDWDAVRNALSKKYFKLALDQNTKKQSHLAFDML